MTTDLQSREAQGRQPGSGETASLVRTQVQHLLERSPAFRSLSRDKQAQLAGQMVEIGTYLAEPEGIRLAKDRYAPAGGTEADPYSFALAEGDTGPTRRIRRSASSDDPGTFVAQGAREGAAVAGALLREVNFPTFVSELINGVFHAIVTSSIEQMEAYGRLVADVAKTLNQFRDENVTANQGRDHLVDTFPDLFEISVDTGDDFFGSAFAEGEGNGEGGGGGPQVKVALREGVDERTAAERVNQTLPVEGEPVRRLDQETIDSRLVPAARTQLASSRQQLLATMVLMGINRILITDGRISAKVLYDFQARDNFRYRSSATRFDYGDQRRYTSEGERETDYQGAESEYSRSGSGKDQEVDSSRRDASYYTKGTYKNTNEPVLKLISASQAATDAALQTRASLAGQVEVNFKSETFPLERMADSFQIGRIQQNAGPAGRTAPASTSPGSSQTPATAPPAT